MPNDTWREWSRPPPQLRSLAAGRRPGFKGTLSLDRRHVLSDSVVIGMVSHKLDAEAQYARRRLEQSVTRQPSNL